MWKLCGRRPCDVSICGLPSAGGMGASLGVEMGECHWELPFTRNFAPKSMLATKKKWRTARNGQKREPQCVLASLLSTWLGEARRVESKSRNRVIYPLLKHLTVNKSMKSSLGLRNA